MIVREVDIILLERDTLIINTQVLEELGTEYIISDKERIIPGMVLVDSLNLIY